MKTKLLFFLPLFLLLTLRGYPADLLPGTLPLTTSGDLSDQMIAGFERTLDRATANSMAGRARFWNDVIGRLPDPSLPPNPRARKLEERAEYTTWEVTLDVWPDVFAWGYLLVPNDLASGLMA